jgi:hypothetical protein
MYYAKWRHLSVKRDFWLHTTSDEKLFYIKIDLLEISYSNSTAYGRLEKKWIRQIQNRNRTFFRFKIWVKKRKKLPPAHHPTWCAGSNLGYICQTSPVHLLSLPFPPSSLSLLLLLLSSSLRPPSLLLHFSPLLPSYPSNPSLRRAPP